MYSRNYHDSRRGYSNISKVEQPAMNRQEPEGEREPEEMIPPDYSGVTYGKKRAERNGNAVENDNYGSENIAPRFPLLFDDRTNPYDYERGGVGEEKRQIRDVREHKKEGFLPGLANKNITAEDMLLCALILLLMNSDEGNDILLILGFLLISGL